MNEHPSSQYWELFVRDFTYCSLGEWRIGLHDLGFPTEIGA